MKKYAVWILIPGVFLLLQLLHNATESDLDLSEPKFLATDDAEIRFYNVRQLSYDREERKDASMRLFRYRRRPLWDSTTITAQATLVISPLQDKAFVMLELLGLPNRDTVHLQLVTSDSTATLPFGQGSMVEHFQVAGAVYQTLEKDGAVFLTQPNGTNQPLLEGTQARDAYTATLEDFFKLVGLR
ncbi:MAG: hypothetical protein AAFQ98_13245 [Bacteroidota bacterium]